jgi:hypothetical protein
LLLVVVLAAILNLVMQISLSHLSNVSFALLFTSALATLKIPLLTISRLLARLPQISISLDLQITLPPTISLISFTTITALEIIPRIPDITT